MSVRCKPVTVDECKYYQVQSGILCKEFQKYFIFYKLFILNLIALKDKTIGELDAKRYLILYKLLCSKIILEEIVTSLHIMP